MPQKGSAAARWKCLKDLFFLHPVHHRTYRCPLVLSLQACDPQRHQAREFAAGIKWRVKNCWLWVVCACSIFSVRIQSLVQCNPSAVSVFVSHSCGREAHGNFLKYWGKGCYTKGPNRELVWQRGAVSLDFSSNLADPEREVGVGLLRSLRWQSCTWTQTRHWQFGYFLEWEDAPGEGGTDLYYQVGWRKELRLIARTEILSEVENVLLVFLSQLFWWCWVHSGGWLPALVLIWLLK